MQKFITFLKNENVSDNTIRAYLASIEKFFSLFNEINKRNVLAYKGFLMENYKPSTINLRIQGFNKYLEFIKKDNLKIKQIKMQSKTFLENVISKGDYLFFQKKLKEINDLKYYFIVCFLAGTGARISELIQIKVEDVKIGYIDLYTKGGKIRRIYIPKKLKDDALKWLNKENISSGLIFFNKDNKKVSTRGIAMRLKKYSKEFGINPDVIYPHSFRHFFAKSFLEKYNDLALLSDLLGHESIETTRIYLRRTSNEQQEIVNKVVTW